MAHITITISEETLEGDYGPVDGVVADCSRCGHRTESFGTSENSIQRCAILMRQECPRGEQNFYEAHSYIHPDDL